MQIWEVQHKEIKKPMYPEEIGTISSNLMYGIWRKQIHNAARNTASQEWNNR